MAYKTILVHADLSPHAPARIGLAAAIANAEGAHLIGASMTGISRFVYPDSNLALASTVIGGYVDVLYEQARQALDQFAALARGAAVASFEPRLLGDDPEGGLVLLARFCDLVVLSQTDPATPVPGVAADLPEYVMLNCPRPVLLVPYAGQHGHAGARVLAAWDGSMEAARAFANALPFLCRAASVTVAVFETGAIGKPADAQAQAADIEAWLGRHGVKAEVQVQRTEIDTGNALLSMAADLQADLLVMGGYGHARLRELLLGGVSKTVLRSMTLPVLMSH